MQHLWTRRLNGWSHVVLGAYERVRGRGDQVAAHDDAFPEARRALRLRDRAPGPPEPRVRVEGWEAHRAAGERHLPSTTIASEILRGDKW